MCVCVCVCVFVVCVVLGTLVFLVRLVIDNPFGDHRRPLILDLSFCGCHWVFGLQLLTSTAPSFELVGAMLGEFGSLLGHLEAFGEHFEALGAYLESLVWPN